MADSIFDQLTGVNQPSAPKLQTAPAGSPAPAGDLFSQLQGVSQPGGTAAPLPALPQGVSPYAAPLAATNEPEDEPSWWDRNGRMVETAAAGGLALLLGPKLARGAKSLLERSGAPGEAVLQGGKNVQAIMAPSTVDDAAGRAAATVREESGQAARSTANAQMRLEKFWSQIGGADDNLKRDFIGYVEGRSRGAKLRDPNLQPLADEVKNIYDEVHTDMAGLKQSQKLGFVQDYYRHQWVRDTHSEQVFSKGGMSHFTKERKIPTIAEGIRMGLTPRTLDPVQTTLEYVDNARRFLASKKMLEAGEASGDVIFRGLGAKHKFPTDDRWVPIDSALGKRGGGQLYAKEGWARVFNNYISPGFTGAAGDVMHSLRRTSNTITGLELGLSGFHFTTMVNEAIINDVASAVANISKGKFGAAAKNIALAPTAPIRLARKGGELRDVYLGKTSGSPEMRRMAKLLTKAGGRGAGISHARDYEFTAMKSFWDAFQRGTLKMEGRQMLNDIKQNPFSGPPRQVASVVGRVMKDLMKPLFEVYIPRVKNGAFYDTMKQWLDTNPMATVKEQEDAARVIWDSIDNRFGESVNDNIFWKNHMKQIAMLSMRSYSWNVGTIREIGGGLKDIASHDMTPRVAYTIALPIVYGTIGALYQYMKTGEQPQDMKDLIAPRTGGTDPRTGLPERMVMPGYMKDVFGWYHDPLELASHKLSTFVTTAKELATGKDWRGAPIAPPNMPDENTPWEVNTPAWLLAYFNHVGSKMVPISVRDMEIGPYGIPQFRHKVGSNLTGPERLLGIQPGGQKYVDPEGLKALERYRELKGWRSKEAFDARQESYYGGIEE